MYREVTEMLNLQYLPLKKRGVTAHYEGSIDKTGGNADWDWELYKEAGKEEWVIFEHIGAGCILNFVQHRYLASSEVTFRFYFDGESEPRFTIKPYEFGEKYPFIEPLASKFVPTCENPIRVVRSFVPMPFAKSCKVTSSLPLKGNRIPEGGWGHIVYHDYSEPCNTETFDAESGDFAALQRMWLESGKMPVRVNTPVKRSLSFTLDANERKTIFSDSEGGLITAVRICTNTYSPSDLQNLKLYARWDGHAAYDVQASFGCLFSNENGCHKSAYMLAGADTDGNYYCFYPMPYTKSAEIVLENTGDTAVGIDLVSVTATREYNGLYCDGGFGYFTSSPYYPRKCTHGSDSILAAIEGSGHIVSSIITGYDMGDGANCEGDVRVHFNHIRTPQIESDGSESYSCYGWGFFNPSQCNPASGYTKGVEEVGKRSWSMTRHLMGDYYPYTDGFRFGIESFGCNDRDMAHSGMIFYYKTGESTRYKIADIVIGDKKSEEAVSYRSLDAAECVTKTSYFEGDDDDITVTFTGRYMNAGSEFVIPVQAGTEQLVIRRVSDQTNSRQYADVFADGVRVTEYPWYFADHNGCKCWLEDEFILPSRYVVGKTSVKIEIKPKECGGAVTFNEFGYTIFGVRE